MSTGAYTQSKVKVVPLYKFMQANTDSTIVIEYDSNWLMATPEAYLLSKKGDMMSAYTYRDLAFSKVGHVLIPHEIRAAMIKVSGVKINLVPKDINEFFDVRNVKQDTLKSLWKTMLGLEPWTLHDDEVDGEGCGPLNDPSLPRVYDGGYINLYLITPAEIKKLSFYAPRFYEEHCKGRKGRQAILKIEALFKAYIE